MIYFDFLLFQFLILSLFHGILGERDRARCIGRDDDSPHSCRRDTVERIETDGEGSNEVQSIAGEKVGVVESDVIAMENGEVGVRGNGGRGWE